jgi:hypothetical protein
MIFEKQDFIAAAAFPHLLSSIPSPLITCSYQAGRDINGQSHQCGIEKECQDAVY